MTCAWNDPVRSTLNTFPYNDDVRQATIPVYQPSTQLPLSCLNSDTSVVHIAIDQLSYQFGTSFADRKYITLPIYEAGIYIPNDINTVQFVQGDVKGIIPNPGGNITRIFYRNVYDSFSGGNETDYNAIRAAYQKGVLLSSLSTIRPSDPGSILARVKNGIYDDTTIGFPNASIEFNFDVYNSWNPDSDLPRTVSNDYNSYYQLATGPVMNLTCPSDVLNKMVPGCDRYGCIFSNSVTTCYQNSNTSLSSINGNRNIFYANSASTNTGCGVYISECYKVRSDPYYKPTCCRNTFTPDMKNITSLTINPFPLYNSVSFQNSFSTLPSYSVRAMYCDAAWIGGNPSCDVDIQDYCSTQTSQIVVGGITNTIHSMLDSLHPCGQWYSSIMTEFSTYFFTQRNIDVVGKIINLYCAENGLASQSGDTQSCQCINSFYANGTYFTPDPLNLNKAFPVVGAASQTDRDVLFTDPVCGSVACPSDPSAFSFPNSSSVQYTLSTLVLPDIILEKRKCPQNICASVLGDQSVDINNFNGGTELNILNFTNTCWVTSSLSPSGSATRTISSNYTFSVQARDDSPPLCGRWQYDVTSKQILAESGAAGFNLLFSVFGAGNNPQIEELFYSITGYNSPYFEFVSPSGTFMGVQNSYTSQLILQVHPNGILPPFDGQSYYQDSFPATILTSQTGDTLSQQKIIQVSVLIYPDSAIPQTPSNIVPTKPLPQKKSLSWSRSSLAMVALCVILLAYALGFFLEMMQIRNLITSVRDIIPK